MAWVTRKINFHEPWKIRRCHRVWVKNVNQHFQNWRLKDLRGVLFRFFSSYFWSSFCWVVLWRYTSILNGREGPKRRQHSGAHLRLSWVEEASGCPLIDGKDRQSTVSLSRLRRIYWLDASGAQWQCCWLSRFWKCEHLAVFAELRCSLKGVPFVYHSPLEIPRWEKKP